MSLILEALKKSESNRRLGEAPDLGTPFTVPRRRRNPLPLIVALIVVAAGIGWWYLRPQPPKMAPNTVESLPPASAPAAGRNAAGAQQPPPEVTAIPPQTPAHQPGPTPARAPAMAPAQARPDPAAPAMMARSTNRTDGTTNPGAAGRIADPQTMRAMNQRAPPPAEPAPAASNPNPARAPPAVAPPPLSRATTPSSAAPAVAVPPPPTAEAKAAPTTQVAEPKASSDDGAKARPANAPDSLPQYYELAYGVRKDIPPFALSMHVYTADAAGRFVVADGERRIEGESLKEGLVLREIRPDGIVLEFRGQQFFYPRPGR